MNVPFSAVLRELMAVGVAGDDLVAAIERLEASTADAPAPRSARQERNRRYYAKHKEASEPRLKPSEQDASDVSDAEAQKVSPKPPSKNPPLVPLKGDISPQNFDAAWRAYPEAGRRRSSTKKSLPQWARASKAAGADRLLAAVERYAESDDARADGGKFVPAFDRWLRDGKFEHWLGSEPSPPDPSDDDPWPHRLRMLARNAFWNTTDWGPKPGKPGCRVPAEYLDQAA